VSRHSARHAASRFLGRDRRRSSLISTDNIYVYLAVASIFLSMQQGRRPATGSVARIWGRLTRHPSSIFSGALARRVFLSGRGLERVA
jgi:hypothetical protein